MLNQLTQPYRFILASASPRRKQFFEDLHLDVQIEIKPIEEIYPGHLQFTDITDYLSVLKSQPFIPTLQEYDVLITSDTLVWQNGKAIGKPNSREEAVEMLLNLSNTTHQVISSVTFTTIQQQTTLNDVTEVTFGPLTLAEINYYHDQFKPFDKAGSYGIQDWIGLVGVQHIRGSYANVMGLPVEKVYRFIVKHYTSNYHAYNAS
ncbi:MAG: septum formation inhibitor Maf [Flavobacterium sp.]|nr:septum formation inhibitor Maf [Flavobacterium sp.]